jgi:hypothetical protein
VSAISGSVPECYQLVQWVDEALGTKQPILITMKVHSKYVDFRETV